MEPYAHISRSGNVASVFLSYRLIGTSSTRNLQISCPAAHVSVLLPAWMPQVECELCPGKYAETRHSQDLVGVPDDGIVVEVGGGVEPEVEPHLPAMDGAVATATHVDVGLQRVRLPRHRPQQFHVDLVMVPRVLLTVRQLHHQHLSISGAPREFIGCC
jgi:hypothetical protein